MTRLTYRYPSDTNPFLKNLKPNDELNTTANMEDTRGVAANCRWHNIPKHVEVAVELSSILLHFRDIMNILEFRLGVPSIILASESSEYVACFVVSTDLDEPTRRFWQ